MKNQKPVSLLFTDHIQQNFLVKKKIRRQSQVYSLTTNSKIKLFFTSEWNIRSGSHLYSLTINSNIKKFFCLTGMKKTITSYIDHLFAQSLIHTGCTSELGYVCHVLWQRWNTSDSHCEHYHFEICFGLPNNKAKHFHLENFTKLQQMIITHYSDDHSAYWISYFLQWYNSSKAFQYLLWFDEQTVVTQFTQDALVTTLTPCMHQITRTQNSF